MRRRRKLCVTLAAVLLTSGCASAPVAPPAAAPVGAVFEQRSFEQKMGWILRLEDQRMLHDPAPTVPPPPPVIVRGQRDPVVSMPQAPPDLIRLLADDEARIRRRAALAIGRVALKDGVPPLVGALTDGNPEVRQMAAFALGLIGDASARDPLIGALGDPSPLVQGSAAEALGLIGDAAAADALGRFAAQVVQSGALHSRRATRMTSGAIRRQRPAVSPSTRWCG